MSAVASVKPMLGRTANATPSTTIGSANESRIRVRRHDGVLDGTLDQERELVAAEPGDGVGAAHARR